MGSGKTKSSEGRRNEETRVWIQKEVLGGKREGQRVSKELTLLHIRRKKTRSWGEQ